MTKKRNINFDYVHFIINPVKRFLSFLLCRTTENSKKNTVNDCKLFMAKSTFYDSFYCSILTSESFRVHSTVNSIFNLLLFEIALELRDPYFFIGIPYFLYSFLSKI